MLTINANATDISTLINPDGGNVGIGTNFELACCKLELIQVLLHQFLLPYWLELLAPQLLQAPLNQMEVYGYRTDTATLKFSIWASSTLTPMELGCRLQIVAI